MAVNSHKGIAVVSGEDKVRQSILVLLGTQHGERVMRPTLGCNLRALVFAPNNRNTATQAEFYVREGLAKWEPRVSVDSVHVENDTRHACLRIHIHYHIKATGSAQNLVYPFYLENP